MRFPVLVLTTLFVVSGCAPYTLVDTSRTRIGNHYSVEPQVRWTSLRQSGRTELWTVDGPALESIRFIRDVGDQESLFGRTIGFGGPGGRQTPEDRQPRFRATMTPSEIMELVIDTWSLLGASKIQPADLRPAKFGSVDGFRFELSYVWADGVEGLASVSGAVINKRLQLIVYSGTRLYYFDQHRPIVDRLLDSIRVE